MGQEEVRYREFLITHLSLDCRKAFLKSQLGILLVIKLILQTIDFVVGFFQFVTQGKFLASLF